MTDGNICWTLNICLRILVEKTKRTRHGFFTRRKILNFFSETETIDTAASMPGISTNFIDSWLLKFLFDIFTVQIEAHAIKLEHLHLGHGSRCLMLSNKAEKLKNHRV